MSGITAILTDIEGTTTPIAFVRDTLFPYARARLPAFLRDRAGDTAVMAELAQVPGEKLATLLNWMDADEKRTPLKALQGMIWDAGYADGSLRGALYPDVAPALRRWRAAGIALHVYSSGSVAAQKLIFRHSVAGDLMPLFASYFDTTTGPKREPDSYAAIARATGAAPGAMLFLSDMEPELDAARDAGMRTCQLVRAEDGTAASTRHPTATDFNAVLSSPSPLGCVPDPDVSD